MTSNVQRNSLYAGASLLAGTCLAYSGFTQTGSTLMVGGIGALGYTHIDKIADECIKLVHFHYTRSSQKTKNIIQWGVFAAGVVPLIFQAWNTFWHFDPIRLSNAVAGAVVYGAYRLNNKIEKISPTPAPRPTPKPTPKPFNFQEPDRDNFSTQIDELRKIVLNDPDEGRKYNLVMKAHNDAYKEWGKPKEFEKDYQILVAIFNVLKGFQNKEILRKDPRTPTPRPVVADTQVDGTETINPFVFGTYSKVERRLSPDELALERQKVQMRFDFAYRHGEPGPDRYEDSVKLANETIQPSDPRYPQSEPDRAIFERLKARGEDLSKLQKKASPYVCTVPQLVQKVVRPTKQGMDAILSLGGPITLAKCEIRGLNDKHKKDTRLLTIREDDPTDKNGDWFEFTQIVFKDKKGQLDLCPTRTEKIKLMPDEERDARLPKGPAAQGSLPSTPDVLRALHAKDKYKDKVERIYGRPVGLYGDSDPELSFPEEDEGTGAYLYSRVKRLGGYLVGGGTEHVTRHQMTYLAMCIDYEARAKKAKGAIPRELSQLLPLVRRAIEADAAARPSILRQIEPLTGSINVKAFE
ncbi:MAG TPA: hypothetical protein VLG44_07890 [Chlamydiales bacterium]|nr:hypothetical protein [Chlamydiales bacterium]